MREPAMAADLVGRHVAVIVDNAAASLAAKAATTTIPIIFDTPGDPIELGLVASLNRPGVNITGVTNLNVEVGPKRLSYCTKRRPRQPRSPCSSIPPVPLPSPHRKSAVGEPHARAADPFSVGLHHTRDRSSLHEFVAASSTRARDRPRPVLQWQNCSRG
jgi:hypothetical protein